MNTTPSPCPPPPRWVPVTERMPTGEDANEYGDVDWSDGKEIWEAHHTEPREATHWRRIVLP